MAYINGATPSYQLHALRLGTLVDAIPPVTVAASQTLTDGSTFAFNATYQRQRPGLLEMNGVIYAGFGSFCDFSASHSRGWVLGWNANALTPIANAEPNDTQATSPTSFFLSSVWMSGYGIAGNGNNLFFSTGNSDCNFYVSPEACPPQSTYDGVTNIQRKSVIGMPLGLASRAGVFTPSNVWADGYRRCRSRCCGGDAGAAAEQWRERGDHRIEGWATIYAQSAKLADHVGYASARLGLLVRYFVFSGVRRR